MSPEQPTGFDPNDAMQVAVKFVQLESALQSMQLSATNSNQNLASAIQGLQQEVRDLAKGIGAITQLEHDRQTHSDGLTRAFEAIAKLSHLHEVAWEKHTSEEESYRARTSHEASKTRDTLLRWNGVSIAGSALLTVILGLVIWIYTTDKTNNDRDIDTLRAKTDNRIKDVDGRFQTDDQRFDKIEGILIEVCTERNKPCQFR